MDSSASNLLLIGNVLNGKNTIAFTKVEMNFRVRGCSGLVERFGDMQTLILAGGRNIHEGKCAC